MKGFIYVWLSQLYFSDLNGPLYAAKGFALFGLQLASDISDPRLQKNKAIKVCIRLRLCCTRKSSQWTWITLNWTPRPSFKTQSSMFTLYFSLLLVHSVYIARAHLPLWVICLWIGLVFCCRANCSSFCHQLLQYHASVSGAVFKIHTDTCIEWSCVNGNKRGAKCLFCTKCEDAGVRPVILTPFRLGSCSQSDTSLNNKPTVLHQSDQTAERPQLTGTFLLTRKMFSCLPKDKYYSLFVWISKWVRRKAVTVEQIKKKYKKEGKWLIKVNSTSMRWYSKVT